MQNITSTQELKKAIELLDADAAYKGLLLKEQFNNTITSFRPASFIKGNFKELITSTNVLEKIVSSALVMAVGFITKKNIASTSSSIFKNIFSRLLQFGVSNYIVQHPNEIKTLFKTVFQKLFRKNNVQNHQDCV